MDGMFLREEMLLGEAAMKKLAGAHVAVVGLGGVGSWCAEALCRCGVGSFTLIDSDVVSKSNINRQLIATGATLGLPKAEVMKSRLKEINPEANVTGFVRRYELCAREELFCTPYDYVADCIDLVTDKLDLIEYSLSLGIPIISALGTGNKTSAAALRVGDISETEGCPFARVIRKELRARGIERHTCVYSTEAALTPHSAEAPPPGRRSVPGSLIWVPATAGMLMCEHIVKGILGDDFPKGTHSK